MNLFGSATVLQLRAYRGTFQKKETVYVPPRPFHSLTLRLSGAISIRTGNEDILSAAPCITYVPKGVGYHTEVLESGHMLVVHFTMTAETEQMPRVLALRPDAPEAYQRLFTSLAGAASPGQQQSYRAFSLFYDILDRLQRELTVQKDAIPSQIRRAKLILDNDFSDPQLSVSAISNRLKLSTVYLRRAFKAAYGRSPLSYLQEVRLSNAKTLLESGYYSVTEVAQKCGYDSLSYFSAAFRKLSGLSPLAYMRNTCMSEKL